MAYPTTDWPGAVNVAETTFDLAAKEFREIPIYITDSCDINGVFTYTVHAVNTFGREESLERTIRADFCQAVRLDVTDDQEVGLCQPAVFSVTTTNVGRHTETFRLHVNDAEVSVPDMYLKPDESLTQDVTLTWACTTFGTQEVPFTITTDKQGMTEAVTRTVTIRNEYTFGLDLDTQMNACARATTRVPLGIENPIHAPEEVELTLHAPPYVTFADGERTTRVQVEPNSTRNVDIEISPELPGEHTITITAKDLHGGTTKERDVQLNVDNCYDQSIDLRITPEEPFTGIDTDCCGTKSYFVNIQNNAAREQLFELAVDGPSFFFLEEHTVRVQPSQSVNVRLIADLPCSDETYTATVQVFPVDQPDLAVEKTLTVTSLTPRTCFMVAIDDDELNVRETEELIPVTVTHKGLRGGTYAVRSNSSLFTFTKDAVELQPGDSRTLYMQPLKNLTEQEKGRHLVFPTFVMESQGIVYNEQVGVDLLGKNPVQRFLDKLFSFSLAAWTGCAGWVLFFFIVIVVLLVLLLLSYVGVLTLFKDGLAPGTLALLRTMFTVVILVLLIIFLLVQSPTTPSRFTVLVEGNNTVIEWHAGETASIDLDMYFEDPDMDTLTYTASQPRDVRADIEGSVLTLTPDEGFSGENTFTIDASDEKGGRVESPDFILRVLPAEEQTLVSWVRLWCTHLIFLELILITIFLLLFVLGVKEKRQDLKSQNVVVVVPKAAKRVRKQTVFYASKTGTKAHMRGCMALKPVKKKDKVTYKSKTAVLNAGLALCSMCTKAKSKNPTKRMRKSTKKATTRKKSAKRKNNVKKASSKKSTKKVAVRKVKAVAVPLKPSPKSKEQKTVNIQVNIAQK